MRCTLAAIFQVGNTDIPPMQCPPRDNMSTTVTSEPTVRFAAVGDLLLAPDPDGSPYVRDPELFAPGVRQLFGRCDLVFGNLECTLPGDGHRIPTEPRVVATHALVRAVKAAGFHVVTLANNHAFDCLQGGFLELRSLLDEIELPHFGAGMNLDEAEAPALLDVCGVRVAFLGAVDQRSGPYQFASPSQWGVAPLDMDRLTGHIRELRSHVDHVLVSVHWGEERFLIPSPVQVDQAHSLVDAGASIVLGHHPHVLQGLELRGAAPIIYSLGNFLADEVHFSDGHVVRWDRTGQTGCILQADLSNDSVNNVRQVPTRDAGSSVELDDSRFGQRRIDKTSKAIARGVTLGRYRREHLWVKTIKPALARLRWSQLKQLRARHFRKALQGIFHAGKAD